MTSRRRAAGSPWLPNDRFARRFTLLDVPFVILFDDIDTQAVQGPNRPAGSDVAARAVWDLLQNSPADRTAPLVVDFRLPDIFAALPEACVRRVIEAKRGNFRGWTGLIERFRAQTERPFKQFFFVDCQLPAKTNADLFLAEVLETCRDRPREELAEALQAALAAISATSP